MIDFNHIKLYRENNRIEAKKALGGLPESIWETYSAFANTMGGIILLGVEEKRDGSFHPIDLPSPEWIIADFWDIINDPRRVNTNILKNENVTVEEIEGKHIIAIRVPQALRSERPIYIDGNPFCGTYIRSGEGDIRCTPEEVREMMQNALLENENPPEKIKKTIVIFLTEYIFASISELSALICMTEEQTFAIVAEMLEEGIIVKTQINGKTRYKLRS